MKWHLPFRTRMLSGTCLPRKYCEAPRPNIEAKDFTVNGVTYTREELETLLGGKLKFA